tara:strand:+ start:67 stop:192 length:126 start_codon:yes stop_codon:yes gene_type:complete
LDFSILEKSFLPSKISTILSKEFDDIEYEIFRQTPSGDGSN